MGQEGHEDRCLKGVLLMRYRKSLASPSGRKGRRLSDRPVRFHPFRSAAEFLYDHVVPPGKKPKLAADLSAISPGRKSGIRDYYTRKISDTLLITSVMALMITVFIVWSSRQDRRLASNRIERPGYGQEDLEEELNLSISGQEETENISVHVSPREFTRKEAKKLLRLADKELGNTIQGENDSLDHVSYPLNLPASLQDGLVSAEYFISPTGMIDDETGEITGKPDKSGTPVTIEATFRLQDQERTSRLAALIFPPVLSQDRQLEADLQAALEDADLKDPTSAYIDLPTHVGNAGLSWSHPDSSLTAVIAFLGILLPVVYWIRRDEQVRQQAKERKERLDLDYSELLFKLTLLLGAGLTIKGAFGRICMQAEASGRKNGGRKGGNGSLHHPVYGEIRVMLREISSGVAEETAYENFGRRCQLPQYIKLGSLLAQNLKKGSAGLTAMLEKEAFLSLSQHRTAARKMGEKASMKMLFPMILMFVDVMIILMVPALLSI